jgi:DNA-binding transcriptional ArsR family regulator
MTILADPVRLFVLRGLCELECATIAELRVRCHSSDPTVRRHLEALEALGLVREQPGERDGLTPGRPARTFTLDAEAATKARAMFELLREPLVPTPEPDPQPPRDRGTAPAPCTRSAATGTASAPSFLR